MITTARMLASADKSGCTRSGGAHVGDFIPGIELCRRFFEVVEPIIEQKFPSLPYAAALLGDGSEVLGFDTPVSTDHDWGPRAMLFLREDDHARLAREISAELSRRLPTTFLGYSTNYTDP